MTTEIIVYRNPLEQMVWQGLLSPAGFAIFAGIIAGLVVLLLSNWVLQLSPLRRWYLSRVRGRGTAGAVMLAAYESSPLALGAAAWVGVSWMLWL
jgi:fructose-specific phosphotransferase system IIC component